MRLCVDVGRTTFGWGKKGKGFVLFFGYQGVDPVITGNDGHRRAEKNDNEEKTQGFLGFMFVYDIKRKRMAICSGTCLSNTPGWMDGWPSPFSSFILLHRNRETSQTKRGNRGSYAKGMDPQRWIEGQEGRKEGRIVWWVHPRAMKDGSVLIRHTLLSLPTTTTPVHVSNPTRNTIL